jgi:hypothetical protein
MLVAAPRLARPRPAPHARLALQPTTIPGCPNAIETLVHLVTAGELDSELHLLYNTIGDRIEAIESARLANALARLSTGDRVRIGHDVRPGYLHGLPATVIRRGTETITIQLDHPVGKYADGCIRCSRLAVEKIGT